MGPQIDKHQFENLCRLMCTQQEIAGWFNVTPRTVQRWCKQTYGETFSAVYGRLSEGGKIALRRAQFQLAQTSPPMAVWLGKQYLNQRDPDRQPQQDQEKPAQAAAPSEGVKVLSLVTERRKARKIGEG